MVSSPCQCPGVEGKVCNRFLPSEENNPHRLCIACRGKSCTIDWSDDHYSRVSDYMHKFSLQWKKKHEWKAKASSSSSSFLDFSPSMLVPLCQMPLSAGGGVVTTTHSSTACPVTFSAADPIVSTAPFVRPWTLLWWSCAASGITSSL